MTDDGSTNASPRPFQDFAPHPELAPGQYVVIDGKLYHLVDAAPPGAVFPDSDARIFRLGKGGTMTDDMGMTEAYYRTRAQQSWAMLAKNADRLFDAIARQMDKGHASAETRLEIWRGLAENAQDILDELEALSSAAIEDGEEIPF